MIRMVKIGILTKTVLLLLLLLFMACYSLQYKPIKAANNDNVFLYYRYFNLTRSSKDIVDEGITIEQLDMEHATLRDDSYSTKALPQDNFLLKKKSNNNNPKKPDAPQKKPRMVSYCVFGGGALTIFFIGWYLQYVYARKIYN